MQKLSQLPNIPGLIRIQSLQHLKSVCRYSLLPPEISFHEDDLNDTYILVACVSYSQMLFYAHKLNPTQLLQIENEELYQQIASRKMYANYTIMYLDKKVAIKLAKKLKIPFTIYLGKTTQFKHYKLKCKKENRPINAIQKLVGSRSDGLVLYGTVTQTGGCIASLMTIQQLKRALQTGEVIDVT